MSTNEEMIKQMYDSQLSSQKAQLQTDYETALSDMEAEKAAAKKITDANLTRTAVESQKAAVSNAEYYAAAGLSSGAKAQARLAQENQLQANLTALRVAQQETDAEAERQRSLLAKEYSSAIAQAQAENDLAHAQALYEEAQKAEEALLAKQEAAAGLMAQTGDYSRYAELYGLSDEEVKKLSSTGSSSTVSKYSGKHDNGGLDDDEIILMQKALGVDQDGKWGPKTREAADKLWGTTDPAEAWKQQGNQLQYEALRTYVNRAQAAGMDKNEVYAIIQNEKDLGTITDVQASALWQHMNF